MGGSSHGEQPSSVRSSAARPPDLRIVTAAQAASAAGAGAGFWRAALARTLHGLTWRRFAIFCAIVGLAAAGHAIAMTLMPGKTLHDGVQVFAWEYAYLLVFFGAVGARGHRHRELGARAHRSARRRAGRPRSWPASSPGSCWPMRSWPSCIRTTRARRR